MTLRGAVDRIGGTLLLPHARTTVGATDSARGARSFAPPSMNPIAELLPATNVLADLDARIEERTIRRSSAVCSRMATVSRASRSRAAFTRARSLGPPALGQGSRYRMAASRVCAKRAAHSRGSRRRSHSTRRTIDPFPVYSCCSFPSTPPSSICSSCPNSRRCSPKSGSVRRSQPPPMQRHCTSCSADGAADDGSCQHDAAGQRRKILRRQ